MSRYLLILGALLFSSIFFAHGVAAGPMDDLSAGLNNVVTSLKPILEVLFGGLTGAPAADELLFAKILLFVIILAVLFVVAQRVPLFAGSPTVVWVVSIAVALLASRWLGDAALIQAIILPYSALGITLTAAIPFMIWFFVVNIGLKEQPPSFRRLAWITFGVVFIFLWFARYDVTGPFKWAYLVVAILAIIMAYLDGTIRRYLVGFEAEKSMLDVKHEAVLELKRQLAKISEDLAKGIITPAEAARDQKHIKDKIKAIAGL